MFKKLFLIAALLLTGCASKNQNQSIRPALQSLLTEQRMAWLGENLDDEEWENLSGWLNEILIPYVAEFENP